MVAFFIGDGANGQFPANAQAYLVIMARELLRDPYFPLHAAVELGEEVEWPVQYLRAKPGYRSN